MLYTSVSYFYDQVLNDLQHLANPAQAVGTIATGIDTQMPYLANCRLGYKTPVFKSTIWGHSCDDGNDGPVR